MIKLMFCVTVIFSCSKHKLLGFMKTQNYLDHFRKPQTTAQLQCMLKMFKYINWNRQGLVFCVCLATTKKVREGHFAT